MGMTMQQLGDTMTAQEFGLHLALEREEDLPAPTLRALSAILSALANGPLTAPAKGRMWAPHDFMPTLWADVTDPDQPGDQATQDPEYMGVDEIMARARLAGMIH
jgi:hypothetical protein